MLREPDQIQSTFETFLPHVLLGRPHSVWDSPAAVRQNWDQRGGLAKAATCLRDRDKGPVSEAVECQILAVTSKTRGFLECLRFLVSGRDSYERGAVGPTAPCSLPATWTAQVDWNAFFSANKERISALCRKLDGRKQLFGLSADEVAFVMHLQQPPEQVAQETPKANQKKAMPKANQQKAMPKANQPALGEQNRLTYRLSASL